MVLVIAEKPSVARSIASVLGVSDKKDGYIEGNDYIVSWCFGHLVGQAQPEEYDEKYKNWELSTLPIIPFDWKYEVNEDGKKQFGILKKLMNDTKVKELVCATDAGREGECIFRYVYEKAGCKKPFKRLWVSSLEEKAIRNGFDSLKPSGDYDNLYQSGVCRAKADWLVGINFTRLFSIIYRAKPPLSLGRVQTPTLAMLCEREGKIKNFVKEKYFTVDLNFSSFSASSERIDSEKEAEQLRHNCLSNGSAKVTAIKSEEKTISPPRLFDLTTLQREANRFFGYTAQQTLDTVQKLYEAKLLTYPRTDSQFITDDMEDTALKMVGIVSEIFPFGKDNYLSPNIKRIVNNSKVSDHHALLPTEEITRKNVIDNLSETERNVITLVSAKLICAISEPYKYEAVTADIECADTVFTAKGKTVIQCGWKSIDDTVKASLKNKADDKNEKEEADTALPPLLEGQELKVIDAAASEHYTQPPKHYTEDTLLSAMETAGNDKYDENSDAEKKGIGTPATRAGIIENLVKKCFIERNKKNLIPTERGMKLISIAPEDVKSPKLTADWETILQGIEKGTAKPENFLNGIAGYVRQIIFDDNSKASENIDFKDENESVGKCPRCGKNIIESTQAFSCEDRACGFTLWKENKFFQSAKKPFTKEMATALICDGKVAVNGLYSPKTGKKYDATVCLDDTGKYVNFRLEFAKKK